jgi:hypothetical protein
MSFYIPCWRKAELSLSLQSRNVSVIEGISSQGGIHGAMGRRGSNFLFADNPGAIALFCHRPSK